ncbi:hypothetical protein CC77DRAFT_176493 [Alternaria alternata]|uniref:Uncharacterized protein n=1 Tax=Alternaria alternata TaxID=5599 RepID=A0A177DHZ9_ALTAL|nr:hypothetical protein CC77DRAFT_176493 [Alternaria alternata]OAG18937.1 hypothetical protein CC77DRAFT_176493 [Alternaria alternata]
MLLTRSSLTFVTFPHHHLITSLVYISVSSAWLPSASGGWWALWHDANLAELSFMIDARSALMRLPLMLKSCYLPVNLDVTRAHVLLERYPNRRQWLSLTADVSSRHSFIHLSRTQQIHAS